MDLRAAADGQTRALMDNAAIVPLRNKAVRWLAQLEEANWVAGAASAYALVATLLTDSVQGRWSVHSAC